MYMCFFLFDQQLPLCYRHISCLRMQLAVGEAGQAASGDRGGSIIWWDARQGAAKLHIKDAHKGHVTAMCIPAFPVFGGWDCLSGGQDGVLAAWDTR